MAQVVCAHCGAFVEKPTKLVNRARKEKKRLFCSRACATTQRHKDYRTAYVVQDKKRCTKCHQTKPLTDFSPSSKALDGHLSSCRTCRSQHTKNWQKNNVVKYRAKQKQFKYGITPAMEAALYVNQNGVCAICGKSPPDSLVVDHCHETGIIRGLLCRRCNLGLGMLGDTLDSLSSAVRYLKKRRSNKNDKKVAV